MKLATMDRPTAQTPSTPNHPLLAAIANSAARRALPIGWSLCLDDSIGGERLAYSFQTPAYATHMHPSVPGCARILMEAQQEAFPRAPSLEWETVYDRRTGDMVFVKNATGATRSAGLRVRCRHGGTLAACPIRCRHCDWKSCDCETAVEARVVNGMTARLLVGELHPHGWIPRQGEARLR